MGELTPFSLVAWVDSLVAGFKEAPLRTEHRLRNYTGLHWLHLRVEDLAHFPTPCEVYADFPAGISLRL